MTKVYYKQIYKDISSSKLLKLQVIVLFVTTYIDWTIMPYVAKLEGMHLPVYMISFYMLIGATDGLIQPFFKRVKIYNIYLFVIILDIIQILSYSLIMVDVILFTYVILSIFTIQAITFEISRVHTIHFMKDEIEIKDYLILRSFFVSAAIVGGAVTAMILDYFNVKLSSMLIFLSILGVLAVIVEYRLYKKFKNILQDDDIIIERQKNLLNNKIRYPE
ncbi:MAG: hypothetical protein WCY51_01735 [Sulfurimonas sp.]|uniref:hypothetical protein n=1 Tax=Sulfurimonas sp. TaxID=2022749 RepID=UPI0025CD2A4B|nr:hypothetical protein [Sulfurimonas sp.]MCK9454701.1 hypothetical protein [Sulfurimonas sp.]